MTVRYSNSGFIGVDEAVSFEDVGWTANMLADSDFATLIVKEAPYTELNLTRENNDLGGGSIVLDLDDVLFHTALPLGQTKPLREQQGLWQIYDDGVMRGEFFGEEVSEVIIDSDKGTRGVSISGRGPALVLEWAKVYPKVVDGKTLFDRPLSGPRMARWLELANEAKARGTIPFVQFMFTVDKDSAGNAWTDDQKFTVSAGDSMLDLLLEWCELVGKRWTMLPGFKLYIYPEEGNHRETQGVIFPSYKLQQKASREVSRKDIYNAVSAQAGDKAVATAVNGTSIDSWHRRELWVSAGDADDVGTAQIVANITSVLHAQQASQRTFQVASKDPGRAVFRNYKEGDWVGFEIQDYDTGAVGVEAKHVEAVSIKIDADQNVTCELTTESKFDVRARRLQRTLDKLNGGGATSTSRTQQGKPQKTVTLTEFINQSLSGLSDVALSALTTGQHLVWNGSKWENTTPAGGGGGGGGALDGLDGGTYVDAGLSDEFSASTLSGWTIVAGAPGSVSLGSTVTTPVYDLSSRSGQLLVQTGNTIAPLRLTKSASSFAVGHSLVLGVDLPGIPAQINNAYQVRFGVSTSATNEETGTYGYVYADGSDIDNVKVFNGTTALTGPSMVPWGGRLYLRMVRTATSTYAYYASTNGRAWVPVGSMTVASATNVWVSLGSFAAWTRNAGVGDPVCAVAWMRHVANANYDPWPLAL